MKGKMYREKVGRRLYIVNLDEGSSKTCHTMQI